MNRSAGLLKDYVALIRRLSGAEVVSLYAPAESPVVKPILLSDGAHPLPELSDLETAAVFASRNRPKEQELHQPTLLKRDSTEERGYLIALTHSGLLLDSKPGSRRRASDQESSDATARSVVWIGLRVSERKSGMADPIRKLLFAPSELQAGEEDKWSSLLGLGGLLAGYTQQISIILDDPVTGLAGRAEFQARFAQAFDRARQEGKHLSLLFVNPDDFMMVNERYGHEAGDRVLRDMGDRFSSTSRSSDSLAKYGGAIFAAFLVDAEPDTALVVANKIRGALVDRPYLDESLRLGVSVGVASLRPSDTSVTDPLELIRRADKALKAAKRTGGDLVCEWEEELDAEDIGNLDRLTGVYTGVMSRDYRNMTLLSDLMEVVAGSFEVEGLAEQVVERLQHTLRAESVGLFDWVAGEPVLVHGVSRPEAPDGPESALSLEASRVEWIRQACDKGQSATASFSTERGASTRAFVVPMSLRGECSGSLYVDGTAGQLGLEDSSDLAFLKALATQLAVAFDRARLSEQETDRREQEQHRLQEEVEDLRTALQQARFIYRSPQMEEVLATIRRVAATKATILVTGESGTGKELIARTIHELSPYRNKPLVVVDCGAIPTSLIESELFGHEKGAYTGAHGRRVGRLLEADGGTVVLDEIGELPLEVQSKLLRFVQEKQLIPVGGSRVRSVDVRVVAVTNRDLATEAREGQFRADLFYRLNVVSIEVPPLRDRPDDVMHLAEHFLDRFSRQYTQKSLRLNEQGRDVLMRHAWPGNVRELQNRIMQAVILATQEEIGPAELQLTLPNAPSRLSAPTPPGLEPRSSVTSPAKPGERASNVSFDQAREELKVRLSEQIGRALAQKSTPPLGTWLAEELVLSAYEAMDGISGRASALLGIPESTYRRRLRKARHRADMGMGHRPEGWQSVRSWVDVLLTDAKPGSGDLLRASRDWLLQEVLVRCPLEKTLGAQLMGVSTPTFNRWSESLDEEGPSESVSVLAG